MRKLAVSRATLILFLAVMLVLVSIVKAGVWSAPSMVTDPAFCGPSISGCPSLSGDGREIAFVTSMSMGNESDIFVINSDGSGLKQLTNDSNLEWHPSISDDGTKIAFQKDISGSDPDETAATEIFVANSDGSELTQLTNKSGGACAILSSSPSISGDGRKIAFQRVDFNTWNRGIFVINCDGTGEKQLTDSDYFDECPSISDDGRKIAFRGGDDFDFQIFVINSDGTGLTQLTHNSNNYQDINNNANPASGPSISGDGGKVAFEGYVGSDREIFVVNSDGSGLRQLTDNAEDDWAPSISGDGSRIVFQRSEYRDVESEIKPIRPQIFVINSDGTRLTQLTDDSERSFMFPSVSDDGERMVFWSAFWSNSESPVDFEYEVGISLVNYLSDVEDKNNDGLTFPAAMVVGGILPVAVGVMVLAYLRRKKPW
jgi:TolB protein